MGKTTKLISVTLFVRILSGPPGKKWVNVCKTDWTMKLRSTNRPRTPTSANTCVHLPSSAPPHFKTDDGNDWFRGDLVAKYSVSPKQWRGAWLSFPLSPQSTLTLLENFSHTCPSFVPAFSFTLFLDYLFLSHAHQPSSTETHHIHSCQQSCLPHHCHECVPDVSGKHSPHHGIRARENSLRHARKSLVGENTAAIVKSCLLFYSVLAKFGKRTKKAFVFLWQF